MMGLGAGISCSDWAARVQSDQALEQWAFGFASAIAATVQVQTGVDPLARLDAPGSHTWLEDYCHQQPDLALTAALIRLVYFATR